MPAPGSGPTCDTAGVVAPIVHVIAGLQAAEALKLLAGREQALLPGIVTVDLWQGTFEVMDLRGRAPWCPACTEGRYDYLRRDAAPPPCCAAATRCRSGRRRGTRLDLAALAERLARIGRGARPTSTWCASRRPRRSWSCSRDGRAIVKGVARAGAARARSTRKYVGS